MATSADSTKPEQLHPRRLPRLALASSTVAPISLIGGWTAAAAAQPGGFDSHRETISALAASDTPHRWIMTTALVVTGLAHALTAYALPGARRSGRIALALGGVLMLAVAAAPLPARSDGFSLTHTIAASLSFGLLGLWPALAGTRSGGWGLIPDVSRVASGVLLALPLWLMVELVRDGGAVGLIERLGAGAQSVWPLVVAVGAWWAAGRPIGGARFRFVAAGVILTLACCAGGAATTVLSPTTADTEHYKAAVGLSLSPLDSSHLRTSTVFGDIEVGFSGFAPGITAEPQVKASIADVLARPGASIRTLQPSPAELSRAIHRAAMWLGLKFALGALATALALVGSYGGWRRRLPGWRLVLVGTLAWLVACAGTGLATWKTYQPSRQATFRSTGVLGTIQRNSGLLSDVEERSQQVAPYLRNLLALSTALQEKYAPTPLDQPVAARILLVSDIHSGNQYPLMRTIIADEKIDAVIDAGDFVNFGDPAEAEAAGLFAGIRSLGVPYLFVKGNHDAQSPTDHALLDALDRIPNVVLLQPNSTTYQLVTLNGVRIVGLNDPRWFGDDNRNNSAKQRPATEAFQRTFAGRGPLDIMVGHEPGSVRGAKGPAVLVNGHIHHDDLEGNRIQVGTFTGGGPLSHFFVNEGTEELVGQPSAFDILTFGQNCRLTSLARYTFRNLIEGRPAYDDVSLVNGARIAGPPPADAPVRSCLSISGLHTEEVAQVPEPESDSSPTESTSPADTTSGSR